MAADRIGAEFDSDANVDPNHVEPVGTTLGEPAKEHGDTKAPVPAVDEASPDPEPAEPPARSGASSSRAGGGTTDP